MHSTKRTRSHKNIKTTFSSSAETIANYDDLLIQVLLCLPIKSLLKFKSVSKHWLFLISDPNSALRANLIAKPTSGLFVRRSTLRHNIPEYDFISFNSDTSLAPFKSLTFDKSSRSINVLQSCNGLLLCSSIAKKPKYYIHNPTTNQYTVLPPFLPAGSRVEFKATWCVNLAFDPSKSPHYKVIRVRSRGSLSQIEIYSSKTGHWRLSGGSFVAPINMHFSGGVFWNGAIHWMNRGGNSLYFDVDEEILREMSMPTIHNRLEDEDESEEMDEGRRYKYFGESRDHLHLIEVYGPCNALFNVYEMERDYSSWFVKYHVDLRAVATAFPEMVRSNYLDPCDLHCYVFSILSVVREENDEDSYLVVHLPKKAIRYNFMSKSFEKVYDFAPVRVEIKNESPLEFDWFHAFQHIESLACV